MRNFYEVISGAEERAWEPKNRLGWPQHIAFAKHCDRNIWHENL